MSNTDLPEGFDPNLYLRLNPDIAKSGTDPAQHWLAHGQFEGRPWKQAKYWSSLKKWENFDPNSGKYDVINFCISHCGIKVPINKDTIVLEIGSPGQVPDVAQHTVWNCMEHNPHLAPYRKELAIILGLLAACDFLRREKIHSHQLVNFCTYRLFNLPFKLTNSQNPNLMNFVNHQEALEFKDYVGYKKSDFEFFFVRPQLSVDTVAYYSTRHDIGLLDLHADCAVLEGVLSSEERDMCVNNALHLTTLGCGHLPVGVFCKIVEAAGKATMRFLKDHSGKSFERGEFQVALCGFERIVALLLEKEMLKFSRTFDASDFGFWTLITDEVEYVPGTVF